MDISTFEDVLKIGETIAVEFKRCGNGISSDVYETVCAFLNRFGGDIFLGVLDDGTVSGIPSEHAPALVKNFISCVSNEALFSPQYYLIPQIFEYQGKTLIHIHVPSSNELHSYKNIIYDRVDDADVKVRSTQAIAQMAIRKQQIFTERKIYPYIKIEDLRVDLLDTIRIRANNYHRYFKKQEHPWMNMSDEELLRSANLFGHDFESGRNGYNLAAVMLLGKDEVIADVVPAYVTDALVRRHNLDRYDDRLVVKTNLVESFDLLMDFGAKHLNDPFFLEGAERKSLPSILLREMIANTLIHREFTSCYQAKFVIEKKRMYVANASRATHVGMVTPDNLEPNPKNPVIAAFFRNIAFADQLGSGTRNLFKYSKFYSGHDPKLIEGDVFKIIVPLDDSHVPEVMDEDGQMVKYVGDTTQTQKKTTQTQEKTTQIQEKTTQTQGKTTQTQGKITQTHDTSIRQNNFTNKRESTADSRDIKFLIIQKMKADPSITLNRIAMELNESINTVKYHVRKLKEHKKITYIGSIHHGSWSVNE